MSNILFETKLNEYCRKFLVIHPERAEPSPRDYIHQTQEIYASLFEYFLLFDSISFKVYGENVPLAVLLNLFGANGVEALVEQGALKFVLWDQMVTYIVDEIEGVAPLQSGQLNSPAHSDPEESIRLGLAWMRNQLKASHQKHIIRKLRDTYSLPSSDISKQAVDFTHNAYKNDRLTPFGLSPIIKLKVEDRGRLCTCANELVQYSHLVNNNMTSFSNFAFYQIFNESNSRIHSALNQQNNFKKLQQLTDIPDFKKILPKISNPYGKIVKLRARSSSQKFRTWLANCSHEEEHLEITKEYINTVLTPKGLFQSKTGRFTKCIAMSAIGAGIGTILAGPTGALGGALAVKLLEPATDFGLDLLDEFLVSGLTKGWTPKIFFDDVERLFNQMGE